ncbi:tripartite-type tricarboxylate transporter receptor subunit TctC [Humitalea rosea]|uniref:Tripartite-type tricarboxylate transporter receptor subunit TctC n=1 Tax=Humitalea rosea TaxID=990373 RepID=A0A2W7ISY5_9PROT|nr:tripartite tricarboxylate transporter substrate binding protein [Humitalea rosea]PZW50911.1 tripartite-type tricarboxylate transporter receptor subunit TctC [Humitalea rosea]
MTGFISARLGRRGVLSAALAVAAGEATAQAAPWSPSRPVRLVVAYPPGGQTDVLARWVARQLSDRLGQTVLVENRPGANGIIGSRFVASAPPDGLTLMLTTADTHSVNPYVYRNLSYKPETFVPVAAVARLIFSLVTRPGLAATSAQGFVALAKAAPQPLTFASWGVASTSQVMMESFKAETGLEMVHVPFQGAAPAVSAMLADQVDCMMLPVGVALSQGGRLKILGIASTARFSAAPNVPTLREQGINLAGDLWLGILAPPGTPDAIADRIAQEVGQVVAAPEAAGFFTPNGLVADTADRRRFIAYLVEEDAAWKQRAGRLGIRLDE